MQKQSEAVQVKVLLEEEGSISAILQGPGRIWMLCTILNTHVQNRLIQSGTGAQKGYWDDQGNVESILQVKIKSVWLV